MSRPIMSNPYLHFPTDVDTLDLDSLEEQIRIVEDHIRRGQGAIRPLYPVQVGLLRTINGLQAATRHLSDEVLSLIFLFVCSLPKDDDDDTDSSSGWSSVDCDSGDSEEDASNPEPSPDYYDPYSPDYPEFEGEQKGRIITKGFRKRKADNDESDELKKYTMEESSLDGEEETGEMDNVQVDHREEEMEDYNPESHGIDLNELPAPGAWLYRDILRLTHVCFRWRYAALSTPELWNRLNMYVTPRIARFVPELFEWQFINAGRLPFTMALHLPGGKISGSAHEELPSHFLPSIRQALFSPKSKKMAILSLDYIPSDWIPMMPAAFPQLNELSLKDLECSEVDLRYLPQLQHLSLDGVRAMAVLLPQTITTLHLFRMSLPICIDVLLQCPNLTYYSSVGAWRNEDGYNDFLRQPRRELDSVIWTRIEHFRWTCLLDSSCAMLMKSIRFHCLSSLEWIRSYHMETEEMEEMTKTLFNNIPKCLSALTLSRHPAWPMSLYKYIYQRCPNVKSLRFQDCTYSFAVNLLITLTPPSPFDYTRNPTMYLPSLRKLEIDGKLYEDNVNFQGIPIIDLGPSSAPYLAAFLKARYRGRGTFFRLQTSDVRVIWSKHDLDDLFYMVNRRGYNLQLVHDGDEENWNIHSSDGR